VLAYQWKADKILADPEPGEAEAEKTAEPESPPDPADEKKAREEWELAVRRRCSTFRRPCRRQDAVFGGVRVRAVDRSRRDAQLIRLAGSSGDGEKSTGPIAAGRPDLARRLAEDLRRGAQSLNVRPKQPTSH